MGRTQPLVGLLYGGRRAYLCKAQGLLVKIPGLLRKDSAVHLACRLELVEELSDLFTIQPQKAANLLGGQQQPGQLLRFL